MAQGFLSCGQNRTPRTQGVTPESARQEAPTSSEDVKKSPTGKRSPEHNVAAVFFAATLISMTSATRRKRFHHTVFFDTIEIQDSATSKTSISKLAIIFFCDMAVLRTHCSACLKPRRVQDIWLRISNSYFFLFGKRRMVSASVFISYSYFAQRQVINQNCSE